MGKFVVVYQGGQMGESPEEQEAEMQAWINWFGSLGDVVVDMGNPFGESVAVTAEGKGGSAIGGLTGYTIVKADDLDGAAALVSECPHFSAGGTIAIYSTIEM
jgi:hypothetical protein